MSKKCLAIAKKAMVWTLAASMLVATPLTASAAGLRGVYSVSDGYSDDIYGEGDVSHTGTVTNTDTNTNSGVLKDNELNIMGIVLDKSHVDVEVDGKRETLTATVVIDGELKDKEGNIKTDEILAELTKKIKWEVLNPDGETIDATTNKILSVSVTTKGDRSQITLNPRQGTKTGEDMVVRAKIDGRYSYDPVEGKIELTDNATGDYTATATVAIKEYGDFVYLDIPEQYVKHTLDMNEMVQRDPITANDEIAWEINEAKPKNCAKINNAGVLTFVKEGTVTVRGTTEKGNSHLSDTIVISAGYPVSKILIVDPAKANSDPNQNVFTNAKKQKNKTDIDLGKDDENPFGVNVALYSKVKIQDPNKPNKEKTVELLEGTPYTKLVNGETVEVTDWKITDDINWSSNKKTVAVEGDNDGALVEALAAGSAVITAKATSNKSAKLTVAVTATMARDGLKLKPVNTEENPFFSGQSVDLNVYIERDPSGNTDALTWSIPNKDEKASASISSKGIFKVANTVTTGSVVVKVQGKKQYEDEKGKYKPEATAEIFVEQGNIRGILVREVETDTPLAKADVNSNDKVVQDANIKSSTRNTTNVSVPKGRTYEASVADGSTCDASSLVWKSNDPKGKVVDFVDNEDGSIRIVAKAKGKVKFTVSGVYTISGKKGITGKAISTTFTVNVVQPVQTVKLNKTLVVLNQKDTANGTQSQKVSLKATLGPKGVNTKEAVTWSVKQIAGKEDGTPSKLTDNKGNEITKASVSVTLAKPTTGCIYEITARTASGASAKTTVKVLEKTDKVVLVNGEGKAYENKAEMTVGGETLVISPRIKVKGSDGLNEAEGNYENVEYSVNKKGIITIGSDGVIHAVRKGTVTITAKTPTNKKATLKITVR